MTELASTNPDDQATADETHHLESAWNDKSVAIGVVDEKLKKEPRENNLGEARGVGKQWLQYGHHHPSSTTYPKRETKSQQQIENITLIRREHEIRKYGREEDPGIPKPTDNQSLDDFQLNMQEHQLVANVELVNDKREKRARYCFWALVVAVLITGASVAIALPVRDKKRNNSSSSTAGKPDLSFFPTMSPSQGSSDPSECLNSRSTLLTDQQQDLQSAITDMYPELAIGISTVNSPERAALCWLSSFLEDFQIEVNEFNGYELIQRYALGAIYYHFVAFSDSNKLVDANWLNPSNECLWDHIQCSGGSQFVDSINFDNLELQGPLPTTIGLLTSLSEIDFGLNLLSGTLPSELWRMTNLNKLSLGLNAFSGTISNLLATLTNLEALYIQENNFSGELPTDLVGLKEISITDNPKIVGHLSTASLSSLETLHLERVGISSMPDVGNMTRLSSLALVNTKIQGTIPTTIGSLSDLETLDLAVSQFSGLIPSELGNLLKLTHLSLGGIQAITGTIPSSIGKLTVLESFVIDFSKNLQGSMPESICALRSKNLSFLITPCSFNCTCCSECLNI